MRAASVIASSPEGCTLSLAHPITMCMMFTLFSWVVGAPMAMAIIISDFAGFQAL